MLGMKAGGEGWAEGSNGWSEQPAHLQAEEALQEWTPVSLQRPAVGGISGGTVPPCLEGRVQANESRSRCA